MLAALCLLLACEGGEAKVYYGSLKGAAKPAEIIARSVFSEIPEYKKIKEKGLDENDPEYWILLNKANDKFYAAVKKVGDEQKHDVIVEKGTAKFDTAPPDVTQKVIAALAP